MNERADRRRPFHRIGQPDMQRKLSALSDGPEEKTDTHDRQHGGREDQTTRQCDRMPISRRAKQCPQIGEADIADMIKQDAEADEKPEVAHAIGDERLDGRIARRLLFVPKTDEQVRTQADQFPEDEQVQSRPADDEAEHGKAEKAEIGEESREPLVLVHVADGKDVNQCRNERDHREHQDCQTVDIHADIEITGMILSHTAADGHPSHRQVDRPFAGTVIDSPVNAILILAGAKPEDHRKDRADEAAADHGRANIPGQRVAHALAHEDKNQKRHQRQQRRENEEECG